VVNEGDIQACSNGPRPIRFWSDGWRAQNHDKPAPSVSFENCSEQVILKPGSTIARWGCAKAIGGPILSKHLTVAVDHFVETHRSHRDSREPDVVPILCTKV